MIDFIWILTIFPLLAFVLGFKHAYDADHLVAVSNFITRSRGIRDTSRMTTSWAIGHMLTATIITIAIFLLVTQVEAITIALSHAELGVAVMLIAIGTVGIFLEVPAVHRSVHEHYHRHLGGRLHSHTHSHSLGNLGSFTHKLHLHRPLFGVGIIHGLASNDELFILIVVELGVGSLGLMLGGLAIYTIGVVAGMVLFGVAINSSLRRFSARKVQMTVNIAVGLLSIIYGLMIVTGLGGYNPFNFLLMGV